MSPPAPAAACRAAYESRRPDRAHQALARDKMRGRRGFALLMAPRTGKTKVVTDDFGELVAAGEAADLLVVAPGGCYRPWQAALAEDLPTGMWREARALTWESGSARTRRVAAEKESFLAHRGPRALVVNVEALSTVAAARALCLEYLGQRTGHGVFAVDESVVIKEPTSLCAQFVVDQLGPLAAYRRIMTGLVAPRSPLDLWNQFRFLDPRILNYPTFAAFRARYARVRQVCMLPEAALRGMLRRRLGLGTYLTRAELQVRAKMIDPGINAAAMSQAALREFIEVGADGVSRDSAVDLIKALGGYVQTVPVIEGYQNVEELHEKIAPHSYRVRLEDCYDMPESSYAFWDVELTREQRRVYDDIKRYSTAELASRDHVTATEVITRMLRLHQVLCGHVVDEEGTLHDVPENRTREVVKILSGYDGKAVVWCSYDRVIEKVVGALKGEFGDGSVSRFWGGNAKTREEEEAAFRLDPDRRFMVATPDAGGRGRDWSVADLVIFHSSRNNLDHRAQAEDRAKAIGKRRPVAYTDLRAPGTVEDGIIGCLRKKIDMAATINGDEWRRWLV